jgi:hypothetical protein
MQFSDVHRIASSNKFPKINNPTNPQIKMVDSNLAAKYIPAAVDTIMPKAMACA